MRFLFLVLLILSPRLWAEESALPEPLTLDYALSLAAESSHPRLQIIDAEQAVSEAQKQSAESAYGLNAEMELRALWSKPSPLALNQQTDDHRALLRIQKRLYDFGRTRQQVEAEETELEALKINRQAEIERRKIDIARRYFDVILSDLKFAWQDEAMATAYVTYDRIRDQHELALRSDVDLLRAEADYQKVRMSRYQAEIQQRRTRALLAEELNRPDQLSSKLLRPALNVRNNKIAEYDELIKRMQTSNPQIKLAQQRLQAAARRLQAARIEGRPELTAEVDIADYSRETAGNNNWRAGLYLTVPLFDNPQIKAQVAKKRADWLRQKAELADIKLQMRQQLLELWQDVQFLQVSYEQLMAEMDAREIALDKSRALYEMEVKTDLGNSMVNVSEMQFKQAQLEFNLTIAWMKLHWLLGEKVYVE